MAEAMKLTCRVFVPRLDVLASRHTLMREWSRLVRDVRRYASDDGLAILYPTLQLTEVEDEMRDGVMLRATAQVVPHG